MYRLFILLFDFVGVLLSIIIGFSIETGFMREIPIYYIQNMPIFILLSYIIFIGYCFLFSVYNKKTRRIPITELKRVAFAVISLGVTQLVLDRIIKLGIPFETVIVSNILLVAILLLIRIFLYAVSHYRLYLPNYKSKHNKRIGIVGAGELGEHLVSRISLKENTQFFPIVFFDDNNKKIGKKIHGIKVVTNTENIEKAIQKYNLEMVIIAVNEPPLSLIKKVTASCKNKNIPVKRFGLVDNDYDINTAKIEDITPAQLLGRESVNLDMELVQKLIKGKTVIVTGGAGSIGSEICRQVMSYGCKKLIVFDINENGLFYIGQKLSAIYPQEKFRLVLGSVRDKDRIKEVFSQYNPEIVFHAAAHKHVPMMEINPKEAIKNNVFGTYNVAKYADEFGVKRFILISTDKAVNPSNIMGATKRICEMVIKMFSKKSTTVFSAVRFGNVLGSIGSVVPTFKEQIKKGGPVTVTHKDMERFFMTIPEAASLVLEASAMAKGGEIFVLDMGTPVKIYNLACEMIRLAGYVPHEDIDIVFTGIRKGEKLYEEISLKNEQTTKTKNHKIFINKSNNEDFEKLLVNLNTLENVIQQDDIGEIKQTLKFIVPTYNPR